MIFSLLRKLPDFKGKKRVVDFFISKKKRFEEKVITGKFGIKYILPNSYESVGRDIFMNGVYELDLIHFLQKNIPLNGVFFDVGANIGAVSLPLHHLRPDITICCFEASPRIYTYLKKNCTLNNAGITCVNAAITNKDGEKVKFYSSILKFGTGSFVPSFTKEFEEVETLRLDSYVKQNGHMEPHYLKVDVEGFEAGVFAGMGNLLNQYPEIVFEFCDWAEANSLVFQKGDAQQFLIEAGYDLFKMNSKKTSKILIPEKEGFCMIHAKKG